LEPYSGIAYAGFALRDESFYTELKDVLKKDTVYHFKMKVFWGHDKEIRKKRNFISIGFIDSLKYYDDKFTNKVNDSINLKLSKTNVTSGWIEYEGEFTGKGNEKYLIIGQFVMNKMAIYQTPYIYIDELELYAEKKPLALKKSPYILELKRIQFKKGKSDLLLSDKKIIDKHVDIIKAYEKITIIGHTDNKGKDSLNILLSKARAESLRVYLINKGVDKYMITTIGKGSELPLVSNSTKSGRRLNRRIEIILE
jgi:outer membrane protein OmpA-like peptidoglycan-associated protein